MKVNIFGLVFVAEGQKNVNQKEAKIRENRLTFPTIFIRMAEKVQLQFFNGSFFLPFHTEHSPEQSPQHPLSKTSSPEEVSR